MYSRVNVISPDLVVGVVGGVCVLLSVRDDAACSAEFCGLGSQVVLSTCADVI